MPVITDLCPQTSLLTHDPQVAHRVWTSVLEALPTGDLLVCSRVNRAMRVAALPHLADRLAALPDVPGAALQSAREITQAECNEQRATDAWRAWGTSWGARAMLGGCAAASLGTVALPATLWMRHRAAAAVTACAVARCARMPAAHLLVCLARFDSYARLASSPVFCPEGRAAHRGAGLTLTLTSATIVMCTVVAAVTSEMVAEHCDRRRKRHAAARQRLPVKEAHAALGAATRPIAERLALLPSGLLRTAKSENDRRVLEQLAAWGLPIDADHGRMPGRLYEVLARGDEAMFACLLGCGHTITSLDVAFAMQARAAAHLSTMLCSQPSDIDAIVLNMPPAHGFLAVRHNKVAVVETLLQHLSAPAARTWVNRVDSQQGVSLFHAAAACGDPAMFSLLSRYGGDLQRLALEPPLSVAEMAACQPALKAHLSSL